jgi:hypothetical protein
VKPPVTEYAAGHAGLGGTWVPESGGHFEVTVHLADTDAHVAAIAYARNLHRADPLTTFSVRRVTTQEVWSSS